MPLHNMLHIPRGLYWSVAKGQRSAPFWNTRRRRPSLVWPLPAGLKRACANLCVLRIPRIAPRGRRSRCMGNRCASCALCCVHGRACAQHYRSPACKLRGGGRGRNHDTAGPPKLRRHKAESLPNAAAFLSRMRFCVVVRQSVKALLGVKAGRLSVWSDRSGQPKMVSRFVGSR